MADLREAFEAAGYDAVSTYIQSGNVLFESDVAGGSLEADIEAMLERRFGVPLVVVVRSHRQLRNIVDKAPDGFGAKPGHVSLRRDLPEGAADEPAGDAGRRAARGCRPGVAGQRASSTSPG